MRFAGRIHHRTEVDDLCISERPVAVITWRAYSVWSISPVMNHQLSSRWS
jgi:hypothetical protein